MSNTKISEEEKKALRDKTKNELERLEGLLSDQDVKDLLDRFKNKFNMCETVYKVILKEHQKCRGNKQNSLKLDMRQVPHALDFAGYTFEKELLNEIFGASSPNGKTIKNLRNAVTHGLNQKAVDEIIARQEGLFGYMDEFLSIIRSYDENAA